VIQNDLERLYREFPNITFLPLYSVKSAIRNSRYNRSRSFRITKQTAPIDSAWRIIPVLTFSGMIRTGRNRGSQENVYSALTERDVNVGFV
jgi:hypothetical protein